VSSRALRHQGPPLPLGPAAASGGENAGGSADQRVRPLPSESRRPHQRTVVSRQPIYDGAVGGRTLPSVPPSSVYVSQAERRAHNVIANADGAARHDGIAVPQYRSPHLYGSAFCDNNRRPEMARTTATDARTRNGKLC